MTEFLKNPGGVVHDVEDGHPAIALARKGDGGWHFASAEETRKYREVNGLDAPKEASKRADAKPDEKPSPGS